MKDITIPPVKRGDTWNFKFTWQDQNTPINLTDCTARMQIRDKTTLLMAAEATTAPTGASAVYDLEGSIILPPGAYAVLYTSAVMVASSLLASFSWEEVPV